MQQTVSQEEIIKGYELLGFKVVGEDEVDKIFFTGRKFRAFIFDDYKTKAYFKGTGSVNQSTADTSTTINRRISISCDDKKVRDIEISEMTNESIFMYRPARTNVDEFNKIVVLNKDGEYLIEFK